MPSNMLHIHILGVLRTNDMVNCVSVPDGCTLAYF